MSAKLFEAALGMVEPWFVQGVDFDGPKKTLTIAVDFVAGSRFAVPGVAGTHAAHDTLTKRYRHLNFFRHGCYLQVRMPRVKPPDGGVRLVEPDWAGKLAGFTLLFEALILTLCREDDLCRGRAPGQSLLASGGGHLWPLCRSRPGGRRFFRQSSAWPRTRLRAPAGTSTFPSSPTPKRAASSLSPRGAAPIPWASSPKI